MLVDNHGREITYLRLAVTDRCNLRCFYCMPQNMRFLPKKEILSYEEMLRLVKILGSLGIRKVRITGGEPFLRKDITDFLYKIAAIPTIKSLHITTNGILTAPYIDIIKELDIKVNLSLDTLEKKRFFELTHRDELEKVLHTLSLLQKHDIPTKINAVIMEGINTEDIIPLSQLAENQLITVRFIEEMPFNGKGARNDRFHWNFQKIRETLEAHYPTLKQVSTPDTDTSLVYQIPNFCGKIGIIPAFSRTFCGNCNRIRITATGKLKNCLYDKGVLGLKKHLRAGISDSKLEELFCTTFQKRPKDGFEAQQNNPNYTSMSAIGG